MSSHWTNTEPGQDLIDLVEEIPEAECFDLLNTHSFGRLAVDTGEGLTIFPLNYVSDGQHLLFRPARGLETKAMHLSDVAFEIDALGPSGEWGWSVVARGVGQDITNAIEDDDIELRDQITPSNTTDCVLRVTIKQVSGRHFGSTV